MLSVGIRRSLSLPPKPPSSRISNRTVVNSTRKYHAKVSALPFVLSADDATRHIAPWASAALMGKGIVGSLLAKFFPGFGSEALKPQAIQPVYMPVWFIDGEVSGRINKSGNEVSATVHSLNSYMPGFSFEPLSTLSFSQPRLEELAVPFTPNLRHQHGLDVSCLPFSVSPVPLLEIVKSSASFQSEFVDSITLDYKSLDFSMFVAYPVLLPVYLMRYDWSIQAVSETVSLTCMLQAHSKDGLAYFDNGDNQTRDILRKALDEMPGSFLQRFSPSHDIAAWDVIYGTEYGFSSVGIPNVHFDLNSFNKTLSEWLDKKALSKSDMDALARYGVDMDHSCVRVYTKEEVDANRRFLVASGAYYAMGESIKSITPERIRSGKVRVESTTGKRFANPEALYEDLKKEGLILEKQKDDLIPRWVRDWRESQRRGQSM